MIYSSFGRYGVALDGAWMANTDYSDPRVKKSTSRRGERIGKGIQ